MQPTSQPQKAFIYYRKNYLFGIARPGALVCDGTNVIVYDNKLQQVFSVPVQSVTIKEGKGIFKVFQNGKRISLLTPVGGGTSPDPSQELKDFMQSSSLDTSNGVLVAGAAAATVMGSAVSGSSPALGAAGVGLGVAGEAIAVAGYIKGQKGLREFLQGVGILNK
jgi:hypothetical protein